MASKADAVIAFLDQCISSESVEVNHYLVAMQNMNSMQFGFRDVVLFFFKENLHVLLNLAGLHYSIAWLGVPVSLQYPIPLQKHHQIYVIIFLTKLWEYVE